MELYDKYRTLFKGYELNTPLRKAHFMCQIEHESNLKPVAENNIIRVSRKKKPIF